MKTQITVCWSLMVEVEVDPVLVNTNDEAYFDEIRSKAVELAGPNLNWRDGICTDCENFPQLAE